MCLLCSEALTHPDDIRMNEAEEKQQDVPDATCSSSELFGLSGTAEVQHRKPHVQLHCFHCGAHSTL